MPADVLLDAVGAEARDLAANVDAGLVDRVAKGVAGVAAHDEAAGLCHEGAQVADRAADDDVDSLHRDAAAGGGVAADDEQAAAPGGARRLAGVAVHHDLSRHRVLGGAGSCVSVHAHGRALVHARAVVAHVAVDLDLDLGVEPAGDGVRAVRVEHAPVSRPRRPAGEAVEAFVELGEGGACEVDDLDRRLFGRLDDALTLSDEVEPFLLRSELVIRTPRGRKLTTKGYAHLGLAAPDDSSPENQQTRLFG